MEAANQIEGRSDHFSLSLSLAYGFRFRCRHCEVVEIERPLPSSVGFVGIVSYRSPGALLDFHFYFTFLLFSLSPSPIRSRKFKLN